MFPSQYDIATTTPSCDSVILDSTIVTNFTCAVTSNNLTISGTISSDMALQTATITISNIINPIPVMTTDPFLI